ncbi:MAG TPA: GGDEF domain-containing protein [Spirochaetia bacterium]|nr:GGDEF domain-containing protein [Spirochaetia bacterium]
MGVVAVPSDQVRREIQRLNWRRAPVFFLLMTVLEPVSLVFVDLPAVGVPGAPWTAWAYLGLHGGLLALALGALAYGFLVVRRDRWSDPGPVEVVSALIGTTGLTLIALVTVVDQVGNGIITPFVANLLVLAALALIPFPWNLLAYCLPSAIFFGGLVLFQHDPRVLAADLVNGAIFLMAAGFISRFVYTNQVRLLERNARLDHLSLHDALSGLANRLLFRNQIEGELARLARSGRVSSLVIVDLDGFKAINDQYGHPAGDAVLVQAARLLQAGVRTVDSVSRWGGEEFLILLPESDPETAAVVADRLRSALEQAVVTGPWGEIRFTASFGVAALGAGQPSAFEEAYSRADAALYRAKAAGKNRVEADPQVLASAVLSPS